MENSLSEIVRLIVTCLFNIQRHFFELIRNLLFLGELFDKINKLSIKLKFKG
jgi:hypothetical protein